MSDYDNEPLTLPSNLENLPDSLFDENGNQLYNCAEELTLDWQEHDWILEFIDWFKENFGKHPTNKDYDVLNKYFSMAKSVKEHKRESRLFNDIYRISENK